MTENEDLDIKRECLKTFYDKRDIDFRADDKNIGIIYDVIKNNAKMYIDDKNPELMWHFGMISKTYTNYDDAKRYCLVAIACNNVNAMNSLGLIYKQKRKYKKAEHYYLMAISHNHFKALNYLAIIYKKQEKYTKAEKYYLMAISHNDVKAMGNLPIMYEEQGKYTEAEKYYLMAISHNNVRAMNNLAIMYKQQEKYTEAEKYYLMAISHNHVKAINSLRTMYINQNRYKDLFILNKKFDIDINDIVHKILTNKLKIDVAAQKELRSFTMHNKYTFDNNNNNNNNNNNILSASDLYRFKIFKKLNIIPETVTENTYVIYKLITSDDFMNQISSFLRIRIPRVIWICICRKLFGNNL